jgi:hypothetical protein
MTSDTRVDLRASFAEKDAAQALSTRWEMVARTLYAPPGPVLNPRVAAALASLKRGS